MPENGDCPAGIQRQFVVSCDLYQLGGLDRLARGGVIWRVLSVAVFVVDGGNDATEK